jgi:DMSO/TMAO reductase YedYZ molybdopterin-dependent catalytic subunit
MIRRRWSRRDFLFVAGLLLAGCRPVDRAAIPTLYVPGSDLPVLPTATPTALPISVTPQPIPATVPITPQHRLYVNSYRGMPDVSERAVSTNGAEWLLEIDGMVDRPLVLSMADIRALPTLEAMRTLQCISNPVGGGLIGNLNWTGTPLGPILAEVGVHPAAAFALFEAADGYTTSVRISELTQPGVLLVHAANGEPLTPEHGYPLRLLIPGLYGQKMPKWITRITFSREDRLGYWEREPYGWSNTAVVKTNSHFRGPFGSVPYTVPLRVEGVAFGGKRAITSVEISASGTGPEAVWEPATLIVPPDPLIWTWWVYDWTPPAPGNYRLAVRATDSVGFRQDRPVVGIFGAPFPDGTDAIHVIPLRVG